MKFKPFEDKKKKKQKTLKVPPPKKEQLKDYLEKTGSN
jgi:hypothetical protein